MLTDSNLPPETTSGERVGARRSEDRLQENNVEINVWHLPEGADNRTIIRLTPSNARKLAGQLNEVADALDADYPTATGR